MIICKTCQHENMEGTLFCSECATQLEPSEYAEDVIIGGSKDQSMPSSSAPRTRATFPEAPAASWIALHFLDSNEILPIVAGDRFMLGRGDDEQQLSPDVDLTPYGALDLGVSRLHLSIRREAGHVMIGDLESSNGTFLNGRRLKPNTDEILHHGDFLVVGKLRIQVLIRSED